jgi:hypothetical protein
MLAPPKLEIVLTIPRPAILNNLSVPPALKASPAVATAAHRVAELTTIGRPAKAGAKYSNRYYAFSKCDAPSH